MPLGLFFVRPFACFEFLVRVFELVGLLILFRVGAMANLSFAIGSRLVSLYVRRARQMGLQLHNVRCVFRFVMFGFR